MLTFKDLKGPKKNITNIYEMYNIFNKLAV